VGWSANDSLFIRDNQKQFNPLNANYFLVFGKHPSHLYRVGITNGTLLQIVRDTSNYDWYDTSDFHRGRYYIFNGIPYANYTELGQNIMEAPRYKQIFFHNNILFAYGYEIDKNSKKINQGFIYHSDIGLPKQTRVLSSDGLTQLMCGFDLTLNANDYPTSMFTLNDALFITTPSKIFKLMGDPPAIGNGSLINVTSNFGVDSYNSICIRDNNYAYMINKTGLFRFDGNTPIKISSNIEPLIDRYRTTNYELKYYRDNLYIGFNDSNYTLVYNEPLGNFSGRLIFGMEKANQQSNEVDSGYFLFAHHTLATGRIFEYPTSLYVDSLTPASGEGIGIRYKTGWMSFDNMILNKAFTRFYVPLTKSTDTVSFAFRTDFDTTKIQNTQIYEPACSGCGTTAIRQLPLVSNLIGRYLQIDVSGTSKNYFSMGRYGLLWYPLSKY
jgi:hypothetical protein